MTAEASVEEIAPASAPTRTRLAAFAREALVVGVLFAIYNLGRLLSRDGGATGLAHARDVWALQRQWRLPSEAAVQDAYIGLGDTVVRLGNLYYANVHFPVSFGLLAVLWWTRPALYPVMRNAMVLATAGALALHAAYPLAPPRMLSFMVDTGREYGHAVYSEDTTGGLTNQFAAMPSMHAGWALIVAVMVVRAVRTRLRWLVVAHLVVTVLVIVATANHYWLDAIVGCALAGIGLLVGRRLSPAPAGY